MLCNLDNEGIKKAMELISFENLTPEERTKAKNNGAARITLAKTEQYAEQKAKIEIAKKMILANSTNEFIAQMTDLTFEQIE